MEETFSTSSFNFCGLKQPYCRKEEAHFLILPLPYESTTTYRPGTRLGPRGIIDASINMELYDEELCRETYKAGIHTLPFVEPVATGPRDMTDKLTRHTLGEIQKDKVLVSLGGEHSISTGLIRAFKKKYPALSVLYLDAHADLRNTYQESPYSHACTARRIQETVPVILAGTRSLSKEEADFIETSGQKIFWGKEALAGVNKINSLLSDTIYISLDVDILDPSIMPATGTPEPGGWLWQELTDFLKKIIINKNVVGMDIVELAPVKDNPAPDFTIAKLIYRLMGYIARTKNWPELTQENREKGQKP